MNLFTVMKQFKVKAKAKIIEQSKLFILIIICLTVFNSCQWLTAMWGEKPQDRTTIKVESDKKTCPDLKSIFMADISSSQETLNCYEDKINSLWKDVRGEKLNELSLAEVSTLIRKGFFSLSDSPDQDIQRLRSIKGMIGFSGSIPKQGVFSWIQWVRSNLPELQRLYQLLFVKKEELSANHLLVSQWTKQDLLNFTRLGADFFDRSKWDYPSELFVQEVLTVFDIQDQLVRNSALQIIEVIHNVLGGLCPSVGSNSNPILIWNGEEIRNCFLGLGSNFEKSFDLLAWIINKTPYQMGDKFDFQEMQEQLQNLQQKSDSWFEQLGLAALSIEKIKTLTNVLGIENISELFSDFYWVKKIDPLSNENWIRPPLYRFAVKVWLGQIQKDLKLIRAFNKTCAFGMDWKKCQLSSRLIEEDVSIKDLFLIGDAPFHHQIFEWDGERANKGFLFLTLSEKLFPYFDDDGDGFIHTTLKGRDELIPLVRFSTEFGSNLIWIVNRIQDAFRDVEKPRAPPPSRSLKRLNQHGLAKLVALAGEIFINRQSQERNIFEKFLDNFFNIFPHSVVHLDQLGLSSVILNVFSLNGYYQKYSELLPIRDPNDQNYIDYDSLVKNFPLLLEASFKRTNESCKKFGFEKSCGRLLKSILVPEENKPDFIHQDELNLITLVGYSLESIFDYCNKNGDEYLSWDIWDGKDELDCTITKTKDIVSRLMESEVIRGLTDNEKKLINARLQFFDSFFVTRHLAKQALIKGTQHIGLPTLKNKATLGSMVSFVGEVLSGE